MKKKYKTKPGNRLNALVYYYKNKDAIRAKDNAFRADPKNKKTLQTPKNHLIPMVFFNFALRHF